MPATLSHHHVAFDELRRQFILAQIELQKAEDARDEARSELADRERLLVELQQTTDEALRESDRLGGLSRESTELQDSLRQQLHVTTQAFEEARNDAIRLNAAMGLAAIRENDLKAQCAEQEARADGLEQQGLAKDKLLSDVQLGAQDLLARIDLLEAELQELKSSRSWRWTAWIRRFGGHEAA